MSERDDFGFHRYSAAELAEIDRKNNEFLLEKFGATEGEILDALGSYAQQYRKEFMAETVSPKVKKTAEQRAELAELNAEITRVQGELNTALIKHFAIEDYINHLDGIIRSYGEDNYRFHKNEIDDDLVTPAERRLHRLQRDDTRDRHPQEWGLTPKIRKAIPGIYDYRLFAPELYYHTVYARNLINLYNGTKAKVYGMEASSEKKIGKLFYELQELKSKKTAVAAVATAAVATPVTLFDFFGEEFRKTDMKNFQERLVSENFPTRLFYYLKSAPNSPDKQVIKGKLNSPYISKITCSDIIKPDAVLSLVQCAAEGTLPLSKDILSSAPAPKPVKRQPRAKTANPPAAIQPTLFDFGGK